jgi:hypothetical protein
MSEDMPDFTPQPWELLELDAAIGDWTGARFIIRAPEAPGGIAILMGGLGEIEERANAHLFRTAAEMYAGLERIYQREGWVWIATLLAKARGEATNEAIPPEANKRRSL